METTFYSSIGSGWRWPLMVATFCCAVALSACEKKSDKPVEEPEVTIKREKVDFSEPLIVRDVRVITGAGDDDSFAEVVRGLVAKLVGGRADTKMNESDELKPTDIVVAVGSLSDEQRKDLEGFEGSLVWVGDRSDDDLTTVAEIDLDRVFAAGQLGEAVRKAADGRGEVIVAPVPSTNASARARAEEFAKYLARVSPSNSPNGLVLVASSEDLKDREAGRKWLEESISPAARDQDIAVVVGLTRGATKDALLRLRAIGISSSVPLVGIGIDEDAVAAMDAGELDGVFVWDAGTLESTLRVSLDRAVEALAESDDTEATSVERKSEKLVVPLRWVDYQTLRTEEGKVLTAPYLGVE